MDEDDSKQLSNLLAHARAAPIQVGRVDFLIKRPAEGVHVPVEELYFDVAKGILGDRWETTAWLKCPDGSPDPRVQVSMTNTKVMQCFARAAEASIEDCGDNLYVDFNLSESALPAGALLQVGEAVLRVSDVINDACGKFSQRFGDEAFQIIRDPETAALHLRGRFCSIVHAGSVRVGDALRLVI